ncbi:MAG: S9 family peptidase [Alphaproteobacteria bacterium]|nr:S9 family peptidase [Alphaproteobacteria bacterium]
MGKKKTDFEKASTDMTVTPPIAKKIPHQITQHGDTRVDNYDWLRDPQNLEILSHPDLLDPEIRNYMVEQNNFTADQLKSVEKLTAEIGDDLVSRVVPNEASVPLRDGEWEYWSEYRQGGDYPIFKRRKQFSGGEEVLFDGDSEAKGFDFFHIASFQQSPDHKLVAYAVDVQGEEYFEIKIRDIATGKDFPGVISRAKDEFVWDGTSNRIFYVEYDKNHMQKKVKCHDVNETDTSKDVELYHEDDDGMYMDVGKTQSGDYITITCYDSEMNEVRVFSSREDKPESVLIRAREDGVKYDIHHKGDHFFIRTNVDGATEFKLMTAPVENPAFENWEEFLAARKNVTIEDIVTYENFMVRMERENALPKIVISDYQGRDIPLKFDDPAFVATVRKGYEFDTRVFHLKYETLINPGIEYQVVAETAEKHILKKKKLPNGHDPSEYILERFTLPSDDGEQIPVTLLRHKSVEADGSAPLFQYGYGSYGILSPNGFSTNAIAIADRGVVYAVAHIRGSADKGRAWYEDGKKLKKKNTFTDFINVTEGLIKMGYGKKGEVCMEGRSAGGMLMGAVANMRPDLYGSAIAGVPFVDVINTISDPSLPLTPPEWNEWGNPIKNKVDFEYMKSYSPYDNVRDDVKYPRMIFAAGLTDHRVTYWEPTKMIALLQEKAKGGPFCLKMNMGSGHFGSTARLDKVRERANEYAFAMEHLLDKGYDLTVRVDYAAKKAGQDGVNQNSHESSKPGPA